MVARQHDDANARLAAPPDRRRGARSQRVTDADKPERSQTLRILHGGPSPTFRDQQDAQALAGEPRGPVQQRRSACIVESHILPTPPDTPAALRQHLDRALDADTISGKRGMK
jgi:hypothetical protein